MAKSVKFIPEFPGQREDEKILTIFNKHWFTIILPLVKGSAIILFSFIIPIALKFMGAIFSYAISAAVYYLWIMFWIGYILYEYYRWYRDKFIITDHVHTTSLVAGFDQFVAAIVRSQVAAVK